MRVKLFLLIALLYLSQSQSDTQKPKLPLFIGRGYDLLKGNPLTSKVDPGFEHEIFQFTYNEKQTTEDNKYLIPDGMANLQTTSCSFTSDVSTYRGTQSYQNQLKTKAVVGGGYEGLINQASFSVSFGYSEMEKFTSQYNYTFTQATAECEAYRLSINIFEYDPFKSNFVTAVLGSYSSGNWSEFIDQFGTHFCYTMSMGGRATQQLSYSYSSVSKMNSVGVEVSLAARAKFAKFFGDTSFDYSQHSEAISYSEQYSTSTNEFYVGGQAPKDGNTKTWASTVSDAPMPLTYDLKLLSDLFKKISSPGFDAIKAEEQFKSALDKYCTSLNCKKGTPDKIEPPPATYSEMRTTHVGGPSSPYSPFLWIASNPATMNLSSVRVRHGWGIDHLQFTVSDGVRSEYSIRIGGNGGSEDSWNVPKGQYVTQVETWSASVLQGLVFITNKGTKSRMFGWGGGSYVQFTFPPNYQVVGVFGEAYSMVNRLGFILAKTIFPTQTTTVVESSSNAIGPPGNVGGYPGSSFSWKANSNTVSPYKIFTRYGNFLDSIRIDFGNGYSSPTFGGNGGNPKDWMIPSGQFIKSVSYRYEGTLDSIYFTTNTGQNSPTFGGSSGKYSYTEVFPENYRIIGLFGNQGSFVNQLGFYLAKTVTMSKASSTKHTLIRKHLLRH